MHAGGNQRITDSAEFWTRKNGVQQLASLSVHCGRKLWGKSRPCRHWSTCTKCFALGCSHLPGRLETCCFWGRQALERHASSKRLPRFCLGIVAQLSRWTALNFNTLTKLRS